MSADFEGIIIIMVKVFFVPTRQGIAWACDRIKIHIRFIVQNCHYNLLCLLCLAESVCGVGHRRGGCHDHCKCTQ